MSRMYFILCLICALWTIIQTAFHLVFVIYAYYLGNCARSPSDENAIFFYLTYLYNAACKKPKLTSNLNVTPEAIAFKVMSTIYSENDTITLGELVEALLEKIDFFPNDATYSSRTSVFLLCFIILDGAWIVSAVSLLMGTCCGIKESLSLVFYGPWLVVTICMLFFDATASIIFGFDIPQSETFAEWLDFVGITDKKQFPDFDLKNISINLIASPSITLCVVSSRFTIIWLFNWVAFYFVMKATISVFRESYKNENPNGPRVLASSPAHHQRNRIDQDTSAARIRNWQLFYGAVDANSTVSSNKSVESEKDLNSNSKEQKEVRHDSTSSGGSGDASNCYYAYPDVDDVFGGGATECMEELRGQLPWSYTQPQERKGSVEKIEMDGVPRKHYRLKSDTSYSGTEL